MNRTLKFDIPYSIVMIFLSLCFLLLSLLFSSVCVGATYSVTTETASTFEVAGIYRFVNHKASEILRISEIKQAFVFSGLLCLRFVSQIFHLS